MAVAIFDICNCCTCMKTLPNVTTSKWVVDLKTSAILQVRSRNYKPNEMAFFKMKIKLQLSTANPTCLCHVELGFW